MVLQTNSRGLFAVMCGCAAIAWGCGGGDSGNNRNGNPPKGGASASSGSGAQSGSGAPDDFGNADNDPDAGVSMPVKPGDLHADCVGETQNAKRVQVDMYIMLDRSGSMVVFATPSAF